MSALGGCSPDPSTDQNPPEKGNIQRISIDRCSSAIDLSKLEGPPKTTKPEKVACGKVDCRACTLSDNLHALDLVLSKLSAQSSQKFGSLTFSGTFEKRSRVRKRPVGLLEHEFCGSNGLAKIRPHRFEFNMDWRYWDIAILKTMSLSELVVVKVPLGLPFDCLELGLALPSMHHLRSLTITDMPHDEDFVELFPFLGLGIVSRSASLRELDLSITNYNRPDQYYKT